MEKKIIKIKCPANWLEREKQLHKIKHRFKNQTLLAITKQTIYYLPEKTPTKKTKAYDTPDVVEPLGHVYENLRCYFISNSWNAYGLWFNQ